MYPLNICMRALIKHMYMWIEVLIILDFPYHQFEWFNGRNWWKSQRWALCMRHLWTYFKFSWIINESYIPTLCSLWCIFKIMRSLQNKLPNVCKYHWIYNTTVYKHTYSIKYMKAIPQEIWTQRAIIPTVRGMQWFGGISLPTYFLANLAMLH